MRKAALLALALACHAARAAPTPAPTIGHPVRLVGGSEREGRVEILHEEAVVTGGPELLAIATNVVVGRQYTFEIRGLGQDATQSSFSLWVHGHVVVASATGGRRGPVSLSFTVPAYKGPPAPTPAPTATTTTVTTRPHYFEDDRAEI